MPLENLSDSIGRWEFPLQFESVFFRQRDQQPARRLRVVKKIVKRRGAFDAMRNEFAIIPQPSGKRLRFGVFDRAIEKTHQRGIDLESNLAPDGHFPRMAE